MVCQSITLLMGFIVDQVYQCLGGIMYLAKLKKVEGNGKIGGFGDVI